ncbi:MAG: hypothetical protein ACI4UA_04385 [Bacteroidaceae bacterium]
MKNQHTTSALTHYTQDSVHPLQSKSRICSSMCFMCVMLAALVSFTSCNTNDDALGEIEGTGIIITDDVDCCSAEEALQVYKFISTKMIIPALCTEVEGKYNVFAYSNDGTFHAGYNDIYFVVTKKISNNYVKNFAINKIVPVMDMQAMGMKHSTPVCSEVTSFDNAYQAVKRGWVSFLMPSGEGNTWQLSYDVKVLSAPVAHVADVPLKVNALADGQKWTASFKDDANKYYLSLVNPLSWRMGTNTIQAYISQQAAQATSPYLLAEEEFVVDFVPTMPDMGGHSSPDNQPLTLQADGSYRGVINLTMTGYWLLSLTIKDLKGNVVASDVKLDVTL